jgi:hypothetical protein
MAAPDLPPVAAWRHAGARDGFEVVFVRDGPDGPRFVGHTTAVEEGVAWSVRYEIEVDATWATRRAHVIADSSGHAAEVRLERDGTRWSVDGIPAPELDGISDVDLEASALTNMLPVRRLAPGVGHSIAAPAAYVRAPALAVERLEQRYTRLAETGSRMRWSYAAPAFGFEAEILCDAAGLVLDYPGIAERVL